MVNDHGYSAISLLPGIIADDTNDGESARLTVSFPKDRIPPAADSVLREVILERVGGAARQRART